MKKKLFLITNESIYVDKKNNFFCDNIDLKSIPENLNKFSEVNIIGRYSKIERSKKIDINNINIFKNIFTYLFYVFQSFKKDDAKYLIISLSPYTFMASILLKLFFKKTPIIKIEKVDKDKKISGINIFKLVIIFNLKLALFDNYRLSY